jgi:hypothetical protein
MCAFEIFGGDRISTVVRLQMKPQRHSYLSNAAQDRTMNASLSMQAGRREGSGVLSQRHDGLMGVRRRRGNRGDGTVEPGVVGGVL